MTFASVADKFLSGGYPVPMMVLIVVIGGIAMLFFSKRMLNKLNIATKSDIAWLETATKSDIARLETATKSDIAQLKSDISRLETTTKNDISQLKSEITQLREDFSRGLLQLKENDLFHTNKAILIMARALITDESVYGRIKDAILENATDRLRGDLRGI